MRTPKIFTIQVDNVFESIKTTYSQEWFTFYADADIEFATSDNPALDEIIPITAWQEFWFEKPKSFYVRGTAGTQIFLTPFDL